MRTVTAQDIPLPPLPDDRDVRFFTDSDFSLFVNQNDAVNYISMTVMQVNQSLKQAGMSEHHPYNQARLVAAMAQATFSACGGAYTIAVGYYGYNDEVAYRECVVAFYESAGLPPVPVLLDAVTGAIIQLPGPPSGIMFVM